MTELIGDRVVGIGAPTHRDNINYPRIEKDIRKGRITPKKQGPESAKFVPENFVDPGPVKARPAVTTAYRGDPKAPAKTRKPRKPRKAVAPATPRPDEIINLHLHSQDGTVFGKIRIHKMWHNFNIAPCGPLTVKIQLTGTRPYNFQDTHYSVEAAITYLRGLVA